MEDLESIYTDIIMEQSMSNHNKRKIDNFKDKIDAKLVGISSIDEAISKVYSN